MAKDNGIDQFKRVIEEYLTERARKNLLFLKHFKKPNKSIEECVNYITSTVQKTKRVAFTDEEVFGMAVHYYCEDNLEKAKYVSVSKIVSNREVELTEEEKAVLKEEAKQKVLQEEMDKIRGKGKKKTVLEKPKQADMFSAMMFPVQDEETKNEEE